MSFDRDTTEQATYRQTPDILFTRIDECQTVLLSLAASQYYRLNETGSCIWAELEDGATEAQLAGALERAYEVSADQALSVVQAFTRELLREGLVGHVPADRIPEPASHD